MRQIVISAALLLAAACGAGGDDWTPVTLQSLEGSVNYDYRAGPGGDGLSAGGDFDGDGELDRAILVRSRAAGQYAVRVEMASGGNHIVGQGDIADLPNMGLSPLPAGAYATACGRGYADCEPDQPEMIDLFDDGFTLAGFESGSRTFWWEDGQIQSAWTGD